LRIDFPEMALVAELLDILRRIYQHETTSQLTKTYIHFELGKKFPHLDIKGYLEGSE